MELNEAKTESIKTLVENIEKESITLPEFQRDFVWDVTRTYDLFDSLVKNIFIGAIIYGKPAFELAVRELDTRPRKGKGKNRKLKITSLSLEKIEKNVKIDNFRIILDGQQRATSLYRAIYDIDEVWFVVKNDSDYDDDDDTNNISLNNKTLEAIIYEFTGEQDKERLSIKIGDVYKIMKQGYFESEIRENFFDKLLYLENFDDNEKQNIFRSYLIVVRKLQSILTGEDRLLSYYLLDMSIDKFALFFERSNSKGITLNFTDILAAKLYAGDFNLRDKIETFEDANSDFKEHFNKEVIIRAIAFLVGNGREKIDRAFILKHLDFRHFNEHWDILCDSYMKVLNFLYDNKFIISQSWMPYENMIIPLMVFLNEFKKDFSQISHKQSNFIHYWYWSSIFSQRYTGSSNEVIIKDANVLKKIANDEKISDKTYFNRLSRLQITTYKDLYDYSKKGSAVYKGILNLVNYCVDGFIGWENTNTLNFNDNRLEDHHIFPKNYMKKTFGSNQDALDKTESVVNKTLIPKISNIKIGDKKPSIYLSEIKNKANPNIKISLEKHLIPVELIEGLYDDYYDDFFDERAQEIFKKIQENIIDKHDEIIRTFYKEPEMGNTGNIKVFAKYYTKVIEATFNKETQQILYNGELLSPSAAGRKVKEDVSGKVDLNSPNGWDFWRYKLPDGTEKFISELRNS